MTQPENVLGGTFFTQISSEDLEKKKILRRRPETPTGMHPRLALVRILHAACGDDTLCYVCTQVVYVLPGTL